MRSSAVPSVLVRIVVRIVVAPIIVAHVIFATLRGYVDVWKNR